MAENEIKDTNFVEGHEFDGIRELDNPPPPWIMWVLYLTIFWSALYMVHYHVFKQGDLQDQEYANEIAAADSLLAQRKAEAQKTPSVIIKPEEKLALGKELFTQKGCNACHGSLGEGNAIGPNLTDKYWLHGNSDADIEKSIKFGFPTKGMIPYSDQLSDEKIEAITYFIKNELYGSNPANAKQSEGEMIE